ncbi:phytanoyl-CoA dioxygenase family protein, partial [Paenibacillus koleovorans]|uniref:phytanoyl-CoA dioxygenase family protein n=1 Tax=Paenibacillus koleovorans TaxID=121608 RepID=UPI001FE46729
MRLLTDEQMRQFIVQGFLILKTDFPKSFHDRLTAQLSEVYRVEGNPGNNLLPRVRELQDVFDHPVVTGALTSVLGPGYMMHAHRHGHFNNTRKHGVWHKDSYWGYRRMRNHRPWWAMIMYFPQDTPVELGPTGVMPGTQNFETCTFSTEDSFGEATAAGEAGTFALIHYDIWHRATANTAGRERFMLKFEFMRTQAPVQPSWEHEDATWVTPEFPEVVFSSEVMWRDTWDWLTGAGQVEGGRAEVAAAVEVEVGGVEREGEGGELGMSVEREGEKGELGTSVEREGERGEPGTGGMGAAEVRGLLEQLAGGDERQRTAAADRLALAGVPETSALHADVVAGLATALAGACEPAALNAAYGLARCG